MSYEYIKNDEKSKARLVDGAISLNDTIFLIGYVDAKALEYAINNFCHFNGNAYFTMINYQEHLVITTERYAMNSDGFHVGYEKFTISLPVYIKSDLGITGIPYNLSDGVISLADFRTADIEITPADTDSEEYYPADEDSAFNELLYLMTEAVNKLPTPDFDPNTRTWTMGDEVYKIGEPT